MNWHKNVFFYLYSALFFLVPLAFFTKTSELFEFNKIIITYIVAILVAFFWGLKIITEKKFEFQKTALFWPILLFIASQILSTLISIDTRTSVFGYYSRFHGGLLSTLTYSFLYFAFVNNINKNQINKLIYVLLASTFVASIYGIFEHFGKSFSCVFVTGNFDADCWVQDVQLRIFSTFGQPNWLAAWLIATLPFTWSHCCHPGDRRSIGSKTRFYRSFHSLQNDIIFHLLAAMFFATLLFTKSRSGILGFGAMFLVYWGLSFWTNKNNLKNIIKQFAVTLIYLLIAIVLIGTPWTSSIAEIKNSSIWSDLETGLPANTMQQTTQSGGTESGDIRKIVWEGAINTWKLYPLLGSGVETFAFSYYQGRPLEHNYVSEWNYIYNKAHNEYLNFLTTTGIIGLSTYLVLVIAIAYSLKNEAALLAGFISILITNFFGFSVVPIGILFFLFPAIAAAKKNKDTEINFKKSNNLQNIYVIILAVVSGYLLLSTVNYWRADYLYNKGKNLNRSENFPNATVYLAKAINLANNEPLYHSEIASSFAEMAIAQAENENPEGANIYVTNALNEINKACALSPKNTNILRAKSNIYSDLAYIDRKYLNNTIDTLLELQKLSPTDASIVYKLGLAYARGNEIETAIKYFETTIEMKPDYKRARQVLAALYEDSEQNEKAREQYEYILQFISPDDENIQKELEEL